MRYVLALLLAILGAAAQAQPIPSASSSGGGTGCVPTGGQSTNIVLYGASGACAAAISANITGGALTLGASGTPGSVTFGIGAGGTITLNAYSDVGSPILPLPNGLNYPSATAAYLNEPVVIGYATTLTGGSTVNTYSNMWTDNLTLSGAVTTHFGTLNIQENVGGSGSFSGSELNVIRAGINIISGITVYTGEEFEASTVNYGTINSWFGVKAPFTNESTGTTTNTVGGIQVYYSNNNTTPNSMYEWEGVNCSGNVGTGTVAEYNFCLRNDDATATIATLGNVHIGGVSVPTSTTMLLITGADTGSGIPLQVQNSTPANVFYVQDNGLADLSIGPLYIGTSGTTVGSIKFYNATSGGATVAIVPTTGALGNTVATLPANTGTLSEDNLAQTFSALQTFSSGVTMSGLSSGTVASSSYIGLNSSNQLVLGAGGTGCTISGGSQYDILINNGSSGCTNDTDTINAGTLTLVGAGTASSVVFGNATSGTVTLKTVTGALTTVTASLPANTGTIAETNYAQTWTAEQQITVASGIGLLVNGPDTSGSTIPFAIKNSTPANIFYIQDNGLAALPLGSLYIGTTGSVVGSVKFYNGTAGGDTLTIGPVSGSLGNTVATLPANTGTLAELNLAETWSATQTFTNSDLLLLGSSTGATTFTSANAGASNYTLTVPAITDTLATASNIEQNFSCAVPLTTGVGAGTLTCFMKAARAFTVDNITATAVGTLVTVTPTLYECGTSTTCASPTTIGSGAVTSANTATPITVSSSAITSGDYIAVELTAGTLTSVAVNMNVEMH
jgi:hypothetical protein